MPDLVYVAVIESIECSPLARRGLDWVVRTRVERVIAGELGGTHFAFRVHSPSRAGLEVGGSCTVTATAVDGGYRVDEDQWCGAPHSDVKARGR